MNTPAMILAGLCLLIIGGIIGMLLTDDNPGVFVDPYRRQSPRIPPKLLMWLAVGLAAAAVIVAFVGSR